MVLFPAPLGPMMPIASPLFTWNDTSCSAQKSLLLRAGAFRPAKASEHCRNEISQGVVKLTPSEALTRGPFDWTGGHIGMDALDVLRVDSARLS